MLNPPSCDEDSYTHEENRNADLKLFTLIYVTEYKLVPEDAKKLATLQIQANEESLEAALNYDNEKKAEEHRKKADEFRSEFNKLAKKLKIEEISDESD